MGGWVGGRVDRHRELFRGCGRFFVPVRGGCGVLFTGRQADDSHKERDDATSSDADCPRRALGPLLAGLRAGFGSVRRCWRQEARLSLFGGGKWPLPNAVLATVCVPTARFLSHACMTHPSTRGATICDESPTVGKVHRSAPLRPLSLGDDTRRCLSPPPPLDPPSPPHTPAKRRSLFH